MSEKEFRENLARLHTMVEINDARVRSNPLKYLRDMERRCNELLKVLDEVRYALSPDYIFDFWEESADKNAIRGPVDIQGEALFRCNKALDVLASY